MSAWAVDFDERVSRVDELSHLFSDSTLVWLSRIEVADENREEFEQYKATLDGLLVTLTGTRDSLSGFRGRDGRHQRVERESGPG
jgi:hypothetical protein